MKQEEFNDNITKVLSQIAEALVTANKTRDILYQLIQIESSRVDLIEDKLELLAEERASELEAEEKKGCDDVDEFIAMLHGMNEPPEECTKTVSKENLMEDLFELIKKLK